MKPLYISKEEVAQYLSMEKCIGLMEEAFTALAKGQALQPLRSLMWLPDKTGLLGMMPAYSADKKMMGIKVISAFSGNRKFGLSSHQGAVLLFESTHGQLLAIVDGDEITAIRTAAVSALATKLLARDVVSTLAVLGSGTQAQQHIEAMLCVRKINSIIIWSRDLSNAEELATQIFKKHNITAIAVKDAKDAITGADIICTTTALPTPVVLGEWIKKGVHINAVGSCTSTSRELDTAAIINAKLYTDKYESLYNESGDFIIPKKEGAINNDHVKGELGEVILGIKKGRETNDEITIFKSLGIAIEDVYAAGFVYQTMIEKIN
ncbi:MAG TPA: ornithine cyclodeaminase family protein [Chitinophagaceae bacterium]